MILASETSLLLLIDMQARLVPAIDKGDERVATAARLLEAARVMAVPVLATEHMPGKIGGTTDALHISPREVVSKTHFSAARERPFLNRLDISLRPQIVICGTETHVCVMQTALDLHAQGFAVTIVRDAVGSRFESDRAAALARMQASGLTLATAAMVMFEWLGRGDAPEFRDILRLIKDRG